MLMVISVSRARFSHSLQSSQSGLQKMDRGREPQLLRKKTKERRAEENKYFMDIKNTFGQRPGQPQALIARHL